MRVEHYGENRDRVLFDCPRNEGNEGKECMVLLKPWPINAPTWDWDKNVEAPTLSPSVNCSGCGWHGHIIAGKLVPVK